MTTPWWVPGYSWCGSGLLQWHNLILAADSPSNGQQLFKMGFWSTKSFLNSIIAFCFLYYYSNNGFILFLHAVIQCFTFPHKVLLLGPFFPLLSLLSSPTLTFCLFVCFVSVHGVVDSFSVGTLQQSLFFFTRSNIETKSGKGKDELLL